MGQALACFLLKNRAKGVPIGDVEKRQSGNQPVNLHGIEPCSKDPLCHTTQVELADGIDDPVPGLLAGGPNPRKQDGCNYAFSEAETTYLDDDCSFASNEIAINWNAPLVYLLFGIEALENSAFRIPNSAFISRTTPSH